MFLQKFIKHIRTLYDENTFFLKIYNCKLPLIPVIGNKTSKIIFKLNRIHSSNSLHSRVND